MLQSGFTWTPYCLLVLGAVTWLGGCASPPQPIPEEPPPPATEEPLPVKATPADAPQPTPSEARAAVQRIYKDTVTVDSGRDRSFFVGDFNGDLSQDIAVVVKPVETMLEEINHELANWIRCDPLEEVLPDPLVRIQSASSPRPVVVDKQDVLLAVIHGFEEPGWRNPQATQTYLLRNAVGTNLRVVKRQQVIESSRGKSMPQIRGDVLAETLLGEAGFVYYTGAKYGWYDPRSYRPVPPKRLVHPGSK